MLAHGYVVSAGHSGEYSGSSMDMAFADGQEHGLSDRKGLADGMEKTAEAGRGQAGTEIRIPADQMGRYELLQKNWSKIISVLTSRSARIALQKTEIEPDTNGSGFCIVFFEEKYYAIGARTPYLTGIKEAVQQITGIDCEFRFDLREDGIRDRFISEEQLQSVFHGVDIEEE